jgi:hypothetical protein
MTNLLTINLEGVLGLFTHVWALYGYNGMIYADLVKDVPVIFGYTWHF